MSHAGAAQGLAFGRRSADPWSEEEPIRSTLFSEEHLARHAMSLADSQIVVERAHPVVSLLRRMAENERILGQSYRYLSQAAADGAVMSPAAEWLIDNFHILEENTRQARHDLPRSYFAQLPKLGPGFLSGHPRIFGIMWAYIAHTDSNFDPDQLANYIRAYERRKALTLGELWAVAIHLRILLIENARREAVLVARATRFRQQADELADRLLGLGGQPEPFKTSMVPAEQAAAPSRAFCVQLLRRMSEQGGSEVIEWLDEQFDRLGYDRESALRAEQTGLAIATVTMRNIFHSLRLVADVNWEDWLETVSAIEAELRTNPSYRQLDFATRNAYRSAIERLARRSGQDERNVARAALTVAKNSPDEAGRDVGFWLVDDGLSRFETDLGYRPSWRERRERAIRAAGLPGYLASLTLLTGLVIVLLGWVIKLVAPEIPIAALVALGLAGVLPASEFVLALLNLRILSILPTRVRPALALRAGVPAEYRTLVVVPTMITSPAGIDELMDNLEVHYLSNDDGEIYFAAVTDWADAPEETIDGDQELLEMARQRIRQLNQKYGDRFFLLHRERRWNPSEGVWMGWERKRGKLIELNEYLRGSHDTSFVAVEGLTPGVFRYVITLDSDTRMPRQSARKLIGKIAHPLNRPVIDARSGQIRRGYSILQPRVTPSLPTMDDSSVFQSVYSTQQGLTPYAVAIADVYQDLFDRGSFSGKGIYDIDALSATLRDRIPENTVLSHDLLEGNYSRSGVVSDVELVEEYPVSYEVDTNRQHRWIRGDWQLLPWIFRRRAGLDGLGIWKMVDNLRRSLVPIASVVGFIVALITQPWQVAAVWLAAMLAALVAPSLIAMVPALFVSTVDITVASKFHALAHQARRIVSLAGLNFVFLAHRAVSNADAIVRTLWRLGVSRRLLLEWTTAAQAAQQADDSFERFFRKMATGLVPPTLALVAGAFGGPAQFLIALPVATVWFLAPLIAQRVSLRIDLAQTSATAEQIAKLRVVARRTWVFFETFVNADESHLPPDNFQEDPEPKVAHRTSPTNIGLYLLTVISAYDFGWIGIAEAVDRMAATMASMRQLERWHGHLYNWYDTQTLQPLQPRYVSSVDSGNLAGHLLVVASFCRSYNEDHPEAPDPRDGLTDGVGLVTQALREIPGQRWPDEVREQAERGVAAINAALPALCESEPDETQLRRFRPVVSELCGLSGLPGVLRHAAGSLLQSLNSLLRDRELDDVDRAELAENLAAIEAAARVEFDRMDFSAVYDKQRRLLSVGYNVDEASLDEASYDLLASEARLGSYVAIAKADIDTRHWFRLSRTVTAADSGAALVSWSGSMFEYLMPMLVMRQPATGLLATSCELAVRRQIEYARQINCPVWGISEAGFFARDPQMNYQYSPFGVPGLGLVRGLSKNLVIAPYAGGLAAMVDPGAAMANYEALTELGARGNYGFYEALDFTRRRLPEQRSYEIVRSYMAHHQGMTIVAIANVVFDGLMRDRFHEEPLAKASELLLEERAPDYVPSSAADTGEDSTPRTSSALVRSAERVFTGAAALAPNVQLMSNGRLSLSLTSSGQSWLRWQGLSVTRWSSDHRSGVGGDYIYIRDAETGQLWSPAAEPLGQPPDDYAVRFSEDRARFSARLDANLVVSYGHQLSPETDAIVRRLTITNEGNRLRRLDVASYLELVLGRTADDRAHPAFSKMFVATQFEREGHVLVATRRRRSPNDPQVWAAHFVQCERGAQFVVGEPVAETDRRSFIGRGRDLRAPQMLDLGAAPSGTVGYTLDPIFSLTQQIALPPGERIELDWWTVLADDRERLLTTVGHHRNVGAFDRLGMLAWTQAQVQLRHLGVDADQAARYQDLAGRIWFPQADMRAAQEVLAAAGPQSDLWPLAISGDRPIVVVRIDDVEDIELAREMARGFAYLRLRWFAVDIVLLNEQSTGYAQQLQHELQKCADSISLSTGSSDPDGHIFVIRRDQADAKALAALLGSAAVVLLARRGSLSQQLLRSRQPAPSGGLLHPAPRPVVEPLLPARPHAELGFFNGLGGFNPDGDEYVIINDAGRPTPAPWTNVVANQVFGFMATAAGGGSTWYRNSRDNQVTTWRNDPVSNRISEATWIRDDDTGQIWSPMASAAAAGRHITRHGFGYTKFSHESVELSCEQTLFVPVDDPVKISLLRITNKSQRRMRLTVTCYAEIVLGQHRDLTAQRLITTADSVTRALFARNPYSVDHPDQLVFLDMGGAQHAWTGDRAEFFGPNWSLRYPHAVTRREPLSGRVGPGLDPCLAMQRLVQLEPGESVALPILLGAGADLTEVRSLLGDYRNRDLGEVFDQARQLWRERLERVQFSTPDRSFDLMMNGWLLYQTMAARMLARAGYYQASGAYGFRDQLQDSMAVVLIDQGLAREHLLRAAGRQFVEGDVQHWWLPASGAGVRTRITDDVVWLANAAARYIDVTADLGVLDEQVGFLTGEPLAEGEHERYFLPGAAAQTATLYEHCVLALGYAFKYGRFGLPLMGGGDWNDGMNRVGARGEGESVWLGWFLHTTLSAFIPLAAARGDDEFVERARAEQARLLRALEADGWDGQWYRRAYFDDGTPLGSAGRSECSIDGIAQSWAVLSRAAQPDRARAAMQALDEQLVDRENRLIRLFTRPFDVSEPDPGYIRAYPPGVRENGGQYTHGAVWSIFAWAELGRGDRAAEAFAMINPISHALDEQAAESYRVEPYVLAADVYSVEPYAGRGGWTWYTGSSGWLYRAGLEAIVGLRRHGDRLEVRCCVPPDWPQLSVRYRHGEASYDIDITGAPGPDRVVVGCTVDSVAVPVVDGSAWIDLDGEAATHWVSVQLGTDIAGSVDSAQREGGVEIVLAEGTEGQVGFGVDDASDLGETIGDNVGDRLE